MIYDGHCHVASTHFIPPQFIGDMVANVGQRLTAHGTPPPAGRLAQAWSAQNQDHQADRFVKEMTAAGIERAVLLIPDFSHRMECPLPMVEMARRHHEIRLRHPGRFWVFIGVDPRDGPGGVQRCELLIERYGFEGLKLYPPCGYSPSDRGLYPYYELCAARSLPVFVHTGPSAASLNFELAHPLCVDAAARDFPQVNFILGHGGVTHVNESAFLAVHRRNVYIDVGGFVGRSSSESWPTRLNRLFRVKLNHKIIFGTDWPLNRMSGGLGKLVDTIVNGGEVFAGVPRRDRQLILSENLLRVLPNGSLPPGTSEGTDERH